MTGKMNDIMIFIVHDRAIDEEVNDMLQALSIEHYTKWKDTVGVGRHDPHLGDHTWPGLNNVTFCASKDALPGALETARKHLQRLEDAIGRERAGDGPYFNGEDFCMVDAAYGPFFQRFFICEQALQTGLLDEFPKVKAWAEALMQNDAVTGSVPDEFPEAFDKNLERRGAYAWELMQGREAAE